MATKRRSRFDADGMVYHPHSLDKLASEFLKASGYDVYGQKVEPKEPKKNKKDEDNKEESDS